MKFDITLKRVATGEVRTYHDNFSWDDTDPSRPAAEAVHWQWTEGNYSCDTNRGMFFRLAGGEEAWPPGSEEEPHRCNEGEYELVSISERPEAA